jgi:hypothetical protein
MSTAHPLNPGLESPIEPSLYIPRSILEQRFCSSESFVIKEVKEDPSEVAYIRVESSTIESGDNHQEPRPVSRNRLVTLELQPIYTQLVDGLEDSKTR